MQIYKIKITLQKYFFQYSIETLSYLVTQSLILSVTEPLVAAWGVRTFVFHLFTDAFMNVFPDLIPGIDAYKSADGPTREPRHNAGQEPFFCQYIFGF